MTTLIIVFFLITLPVHPIFCIWVGAYLTMFLEYLGLKEVYENPRPGTAAGMGEAFIQAFLYGLPIYILLVGCGALILWMW